MYFLHYTENKSKIFCTNFYFFLAMHKMYFGREYPIRKRGLKTSDHCPLNSSHQRLEKITECIITMFTARLIALFYKLNLDKK